MARSQRSNQEPGFTPRHARSSSTRTARSAPTRKPYGIVDIGSNSVRLVVYDELGRAPLPRFNEKSMCRLGEGLAETGAIAEENFRRTVEAVRRFRAIADAMGVARLDATATEAVRRASNGPDLVAAIAREAGLAVRVLSGAEEAHFAAQGVISGLFRPVGLVGDMGGGSLEVAEALDDRVGERWVSLPLGALPVQSLLKDGGAGGQGPDRRAAARGPAAGADRAGVLRRRRRLPGAGQGAHGGGRGAGAGGARLHAWRRTRCGRSPRSSGTWRRRSWPACPGVASRRVSTLPAAAIVLDRVIKHLGPERVVFSALGLREGWLYAQLPEAERYLDPLVEGAQLFGLPLARVPALRAGLGALDRRAVPGRDAGRPPPARSPSARCPTSPGATTPTCGPRRASAACSSSRSSASTMPSASSWPWRSTPATPAAPTPAGWSRPSRCSPPSLRRRAMILGRALLLGYRFSGGVPEILAGARLHIGADIVRLEVGRAARVPDSEVVGDRLRLLATAIGVRRTEIVEAG